MAFKIAIASGKGGTGKTTVSVNLYYFIWKYLTQKVLLVDCDVEEPNDALFFKESDIVLSTKVNQPVASINPSKCTYCKKCSEYCEFNAISVIPKVNFAEVDKSLCHSCGACSVACEYGAIVEIPERIGVINKYEYGIGKGLFEGVLQIGSPQQTMLIKELKKTIPQDLDIIIYDAPPGTSCQVVETISDADLIILVTEPTPFGLHDLKLAIELVQDINIPFGVIINKAGMGNNELQEYLNMEKIDLFGSIPFSKSYAMEYANGELFRRNKEFESEYLQIVEKLKQNYLSNETANHS